MSLTVGSLFSGIGGIDLGLERAGMVVKWQCELDPFCSQVLAKHWPGVPNLGDVTKVDWEGVERVDLICGGYPCQPFSSAGLKRSDNDERHLWPNMFDAIRVLRPRFALMENVPGHLARGFGRVLGDLAEIGYDCEWDCIPARAVGSPISAHGRDRVFIVAHADEGRLGWSRLSRQARRELVACASRRDRAVSWLPGTASDYWPDSAGVRRVAHGVPRRVDRLRALGNAVVPQVAQFIGEQLLASLDRAVLASRRQP
jgi:DNA (cytosine-5)-methyltransferase 1